MAAYDLEEQEQLDELKRWWKHYGNRLLNVLLAILLGILAWQGWNWYQNRRIAEASMIFYHLQEAAQKKEFARVKVTSGELLEKYQGLPYASMGALLAAKSLVEAGDVQTARTQLQWVVDHDKDDLRDLARLRLAALLIDEKQYDEALKQVDGNRGAVFEARFQDTRGDILKAQGKTEEAKKAYQLAITRIADARRSAKGQDWSQDWQIQADEAYRELVRQKLDALGGGA